MADDELFENLDDFGDLDEEPDFGLVEDEFPLDLMEPEPEGPSRTFKIVGGIIALAVLVIIILLIVFAVGGGGDLSPNEKTSTAVVQLNQTIEAEYNATLTALAQIEAVTKTAVFNSEQTATAEVFAHQTQEALAATAAAQTATAEFVANQTLAAQQTATQNAINDSLTATAEANRLAGVVVDEEGTIFGNVTLKLYRDDGDGVFNPADRTPAPGPVAAGGQALSYGESVDGELEVGASVEWRFTGAAGDVVTISAVAGATGLDLFLELVGPGGTVLTGDDDSGGGADPRIAGFALSQSGEHTIRVSSVSGSGAYTLTLAAEQSSTASRSTGVDDGIVLVQAGSTPTPEISLDELVDVITTTSDGSFDFGSLEPGIYWLELDFESLPPDLQALVPVGEPVVIMVTVPVQGEVTFTIGAPPVPTATPTPEPPELSPFDMTATARAAVVDIVTLTPTSEPGEVVTALPETGLFTDIGDKTSEIEGTSGLTLLAIAAAGLVAVVVIARKLRTSA